MSTTSTMTAIFFIRKKNKKYDPALNYYVNPYKIPCAENVFEKLLAYDQCFKNKWALLTDPNVLFCFAQDFAKTAEFLKRKLLAIHIGKQNSDRQKNNNVF